MFCHQIFQELILKTRLPWLLLVSKMIILWAAIRLHTRHPAVVRGGKRRVDPVTPALLATKRSENMTLKRAMTMHPSRWERRWRCQRAPRSVRLSSKSTCPTWYRLRGLLEHSCWTTWLSTSVMKTRPRMSTSPTGIHAQASRTTTCPSTQTKWWVWAIILPQTRRVAPKRRAASCSLTQRARAASSLATRKLSSCTILSECYQRLRGETSMTGRGRREQRSSTRACSTKCLARIAGWRRDTWSSTHTPCSCTRMTLHSTVSRTSQCSSSRWARSSRSSKAGCRRALWHPGASSHRPEASKTTFIALRSYCAVASRKYSLWFRITTASRSPRTVSHRKPAQRRKWMRTNNFFSRASRLPWSRSSSGRSAKR